MRKTHPAGVIWSAVIKFMFLWEKKYQQKKF